MVNDNPTCDFCGKTASEVESMIASHSETHICSECITLCYTIVSKTKEIINE